MWKKTSGPQILQQRIQKKQKSAIVPTLRSATKKKTSCKFCGLCGHRINNCDIKQGLGIEQEGPTLVQYMLEKAPYKILNADDKDSIICTDISNRSVSRHMKVHTIHSKSSQSLMCNLSADQLVARITLYDG